MQKWMILYGVTVLAAIAGDVAITLRANDIREQKGLKKMTYVPPFADLLTYFIPIFNLYCFIAYGHSLFFVTDKEFLEIMEKAEGYDDKQL